MINAYDFQSLIFSWCICYRSKIIEIGGYIRDLHQNIVYRVKAEKASKKEGDIFDAKKEAYKPSKQRKADQVTVDTQILEAIKKNAEGKVLK